MKAPPDSLRALLSGISSVRQSASIALFGLSFACGGGDAVAPLPQEPSPARVITLSAVSPTSLNSIVGAVPSSLPEVIVKDADGHPVVGVPVIFSIVKGDGGISGATSPNDVYTTTILEVVTGGNGIARLTVWRMGYHPGDNVVSAKAEGAPSVNFVAYTVASAPASITKTGGDNQIVSGGTAAAVRPRVTVFDTYSNPVSGATVRFVVMAGGGSVTGATVVSDESGAASVGSWIVGADGSQSISASVDGLAATATFSALAVNLSSPCGQAIPLAQASTTVVNLTSQSCRSTDGKYFTMASVTLTTPDAYLFTTASPDSIHTSLQLLGSQLLGSHLLASDNASGANTNSRIKAILPPGTYTLLVTSTTAGALGKVSISSDFTFANVTDCEQVFVVKGTRTRQSIQQRDCGTSGDQFDRYAIYLTAGESVAVDVEDLSYSNHTLNLTNGAGGVMASGNFRAPYTFGLVFTAPEDGFYFINTGSEEYGAEYMLDIH